MTRRCAAEGCSTVLRSTRPGVWCSLHEQPAAEDKRPGDRRRYKSCEAFAASRFVESRNHYLWHWRHGTPPCKNAVAQRRRAEKKALLRRMKGGQDGS